MRLEIGEQPEATTHISLAKGCDDVCVMAARDDYCSIILLIRPDGTLLRPKNVSPALGFKLDTQGRVRLNE